MKEPKQHIDKISVIDFYGKQTRFERFKIINDIVTESVNKAQLIGAKRLLRRFKMLFMYVLLVRRSKMIGRATLNYGITQTKLAILGLTIKMGPIPPRRIIKQIRRQREDKEWIEQQLKARAPNITIPFPKNPQEDKIN